MAGVAAAATSRNTQMKRLICKGWVLHAEGKNIIHGGAGGRPGGGQASVQNRAAGVFSSDSLLLAKRCRLMSRSERRELESDQDPSKSEGPMHKGNSPVTSTSGVLLALLAIAVTPAIYSQTTNASSQASQYQIG